MSPGAAPGGVLTNRLFWALYGVAMAVMGSGLPFWDWPPSSTDVEVLVFCTLVFAGLAQPYAGRPVVAAMRVHRLAAVHRNTLLIALYVTLVATKQPPLWAVAVDAALLCGYLLLIDAVTVPLATLRRLASPPLLAGTAALTAGAVALVALPGSDAAYRPVLAALAGAAALTAAVATAFGRGETRRVGSRGTAQRPPDRQEQDRPPR
ncbi:hypothetical protein GCM10009839_82160 [Catenulispora yoronensis]|uniref:Sensor histidine kinase n=1 Tax=Catenulispora yoronensis TaxID=450799 RepID=A0ABN2VD31_9ACTN